MKQFNKLAPFFLVVIFAMLTGNVISQITAPNAVFKSQTNYSEPLKEENVIFTFCDPVGLGAGELVATPLDGTAGWTFTWTKWDSNTSDFTTPVAVVANQSESNLSNLTDGLYRVAISKVGETDEVGEAWVLNRVSTVVQPVFERKRRDCAGVYFTASLSNQLKYLDVPTANEISLPTDYTFELFREGVSIHRSPVPNYNGESSSFYDGEIFEGEEEYVMVVEDECGNKYTSVSVFSDTYVISAEFTADPMEGQASLVVNFQVKNSYNIDSYKWFIYQDFDRLESNLSSVKDSLLTSEGIVRLETPVYTYLHPGSYFVKLIASSDKGSTTCVDKFFLKTAGTPIVVDASLVEYPNFFTPNGGQNPIFKVYTKSVKDFHAVIFNRWGRVVYEWKDVNGGWDGKVNGKWATPGTYFLVITAEGKEEEGKKYTEKGSFMLIRK